MQQKSQPLHLTKTALALLLILLISLLAAAYFLRSNPERLLVFDDSYITLRFAANFFTYKGITYDGSTFLSGATSPLHVFCIALLGRFMELEEASLATGIMFFLCSVVLVYLWTLVIYNNRACALLAGVLTATSGWLIFDSLNGLETTAFICFSLLTLYLYHRFQYKPLYTIPLMLSILTRPEGWFLAFALWMSQFSNWVIGRDTKAMRRLFTSLGIFFVFFVVPYVSLTFYFTGSLLSGTAFTKSVFFAEYRRIGALLQGVELFYHRLLYPLPLLIFPLALFASRVLRLSCLWWYGGIFYLCYFFFFPGATLHYWCRYQHIFIPLLIVAIAGGACELLQMCRKRSLQIALGALIAASLLYNQSVSFKMVSNTYGGATECTKKTMLDLALWVKQNTPDDALIALHDIGAVGYFSRRRMVDLVGLTNPEVSAYYWDSRAKRPFKPGERNVIEYLRVKKPDYLIMIPDWDRFFNLFQPANRKYFQLVYTTPPLYPSPMRYEVFKCTWENND
jgi:hypothetical protein